MLAGLTDLVSSYGYLGIFLIMMLNSDFVPLFTEATLPFAGFLASQGILLVPLIILASVAGDLAGGTIAYYIGRFLDEKIILNLINKYGRYVFLKEQDYKKTVELVKRKGISIVFIAKLTPGLKAWTSVASGICSVDFKKYLLASSFASLIYNSILVIAGYQLGKNWENISSFFSKLQFIPIILFLILLSFFILRRKKLI